MKNFKRALSLLLALLLAASMLTTAFADEAETSPAYTPAETYTLNYNGAYSGAKWQYFSPYWPAFRMNGTADYTQSISFSLYSTTTGEVLPVYCTDIETGLATDSNFRRLNLEDSTYAAAGAGLLRSIVLKGFPTNTVEVLGAAAGVENLTVGEAVAATQAAIWQAAHGARLSFTDFCRTIDTEWAPDGTVHYDECNAEIVNGYAAAENEALIESHIEAVFNYLVGLEPTAPAEVAVSGNSFVSWSDAPTLTKNEDGTYNVSVEATVNVTMKGNDTLTLSAVIGGYYASAALAHGANTVSLTIENVPANVANGEVTLAIDGTQTVSDVFLFDAEGDRGVSQSLIGRDSSQLPVHAEVTVEAERILNFYKTTKVATGNDSYELKPLEGIIFDIYLAAELDEYLNGEKKLGTAAEEASHYIYQQADYTAITDADGKATVNLTKNGMPDGVYLVVERDQTAIEKPVDPFFVIIPATNAEGTGHVYEINIQPKNDVVGNVKIEKDVLSLGNDEGVVDAYKNHTWIIGATIPEDIGTGKSYVIRDTLDNRLDYADGTLKVQVETVDGETVAATLTQGTDYLLSVTDNDSLAEGKLSDSFAVSLTVTGMKKVAEAVAGDFAGHMIRVYFDAQINANAEMGEEIPNQATLDYTNSVNFDFSVESDIPVVETGAANLLKVDAKDNTKTLAGATFQVYRIATEADMADESIEKVDIDGINGAAVLVEFFDNAAMAGDKVTSVTSGEDGKIAIYGLAYGTYYVVETKAPAGYNLLGEPAEIIINESSHTAEKVITVENTAGAILPETGGMGTHVFFAAGIVLVCAAGLLFSVKKCKTC